MPRGTWETSRRAGWTCPCPVREVTGRTELTTSVEPLEALHGEPGRLPLV